MMNISEANKNSLKYAGEFILYLILPVLISSYLLGDPFLSAIIENKLWYLLFAFIIGAFDATKDTLSDHFSTSIFKNLNPLFWDKIPSSVGKKILGMRFNGWHITKMLETLFICLTVVYFVKATDHKWSDYILVYGFKEWGFNLFYNKLLKTNDD